MNCGRAVLGLPRKMEVDIGHISSKVGTFMTLIWFVLGISSSTSWVLWLPEVPPPIQLLYRFWNPKSVLKFSWDAFYLWSHIPRAYSVFTIHKAIGDQINADRRQPAPLPPLSALRCPSPRRWSSLTLMIVKFSIQMYVWEEVSEPWRLCVLIHLR